MSLRIQPKQLQGKVHIPPSKSMAHRAIICASLARGRSIISNIQYSKDIEATISAMKALGTMIFQHDDYLEIDGTTTFMRNNGEIDCHESGSTLRFIIPISLVQPSNFHFKGEGRLGKRPLDVYYQIFEKQNIGYLYKENVLDLYVMGQLHAGTFEIAGDVSSQFISGLLFALPLLPQDSRIIITSPLQSKGYVDLTIQMLQHYGVFVINNEYQELIIPGGQHYHAHDYEVEGDFSQAAFYLVAGALGNDVILEGLNFQSKQGDKVAIDILKKMGCQFYQEEDSCRITCASLQGTTIDGTQCPDIIPVVAMACANAKGKSVIKNVERLRLKECDRLKATVDMIQQLGGQVIENQDSMEIIGVKKLKGGQVTSSHDHRMAMSAAIVSSVCEDVVVLDDYECVEKSYPDFWKDFKSLGGECSECKLGNDN